MLSGLDQSAEIVDLQRGDMAAFDTIYYRYHEPVFRNILRFIYQYDVAEDILQEVFISLWEHRAELNAQRPVDAWLFVVSHNKAINWLKKNSKEKNTLQALPVTVYDQEDTPMQEQLFQEQVALLNDAVDQLPLRKKQAFRLCRLEGRSYEEAGQLLGISSDTVREYVKTSSQIIRRHIAAQPVLPALIGLPVAFFLSF